MEEEGNLNKSVGPTTHGQSQLDKLDKTNAKTYVQQQLHILGKFEYGNIQGKVWYLYLCQFNIYLCIYVN